MTGGGYAILLLLGVNRSGVNSAKLNQTLRLALQLTAGRRYRIA